jgi:hypothetical protein
VVYDLEGRRVDSPNRFSFGEHSQREFFPARDFHRAQSTKFPSVDFIAGRVLRGLDVTGHFKSLLHDDLVKINPGMAPPVSALSLIIFEHVQALVPGVVARPAIVLGSEQVQDALLLTFRIKQVNMTTFHQCRR